MADLSGRPAELRPLRGCGLALLPLLLLVGARPAAAQGDPDARATAEVEIGSTRLRGGWVPETGSALSFRLSGAVAVGVAVRVALQDRVIAASPAESPYRLHFAYAGLRVDVVPPLALGLGLRPRLGVLVGAGNARVEDAASALIDSDNGLVVEPGLSAELPLAGPLAAVGAASWRFASGFAVGGAVGGRDLRGPTVALGLRVGPF